MASTAQLFLSDHGEDSDAANGFVSACSNQDNEHTFSETSVSSDLNELTLEELQEIEEAYPEDYEGNNNSIEFVTHVGIARRVTFWSPEAGHVRVNLTLRPIKPADLVLKESEPVEREPRSPPTYWPSRLPDVASSSTSLPPHNASHIQEVRDFLSIPSSVPTNMIPTFLIGHRRLLESVKFGMVFTRGRVSARRPYIWLLSHNHERSYKVYCNMLTIVWEDDLEEDIREPEWDEDDSDDPNEAWRTMAASTLDLVHLDEEDEASFWQAVEDSQSSQANNSRLVTETQQPRLPTDSQSPHRVKESSVLVVELFVRFDELDQDSDEAD